MTDAAFDVLFQDPRFSALRELADNPEIQELIAGAVRARELLIDRVIELAGQRGVQLTKVSRHSDVDTIGTEHNLLRSDWNLDLTEWLKANNLSWSNLTAA